MPLPRRLTSPARAPAAALILFAAGFGCVKASQNEVCRASDLARCVVEEVAIIGNRRLSSADIEEQIATAETSHLLGGALQGVPVLSVLDAASVEYERFDRFIFGQDLKRVERYYRSRGFFDARARAGRVVRRSDGRVRVEIIVDEGRPTRIGRVDLEWKDDVLPPSSAAVDQAKRARDELRIGARFEERAYESVKRQLERALTDRGFARASVVGRVKVDLARREAQIAFAVDPGPPCVFGDVSLVGAGELPEAPLRSALGFKKGDPFSTSALDSAQIALAGFGVFAAVDVRPNLSPSTAPQSTAVPVVVELQPSPLRAVKAGVGAEIGSVVQAHLVGGWDNRNFFGGLRRLVIEARPGLVFYPWTISSFLQEPPTNVLPQLKSRFELSQPLPFDPRTNARLRGEFNLYSPPRGEGEPTPYILGYRTYSGALGLDRPFFNGEIRGDLFFNVELNDPFSYNAVPIPSGFNHILVPSIQTVASLDLRRDASGRPDPVTPNRGLYVKTDLQFAGRFLGGSADDVRISPEIRGYVPLGRRVTVALRWAAGFIVASNYPTRCADPSASAPWDNSCSPNDVQLLGLRGFFSGGANSNRGYGYRGVGPHQKVESLYLVPGTFDSSNDAVPLGGLTLWETSAELRFPIGRGALGGALFFDASDVSLNSGELRFTRPHLTAGIGLRYATPVGPARLDVGYRVACAQVIGVCDPQEIHAKHPEEAVPGELFGLPITVSLAIGEAY